MRQTVAHATNCSTSTFCSGHTQFRASCSFNMDKSSREWSPGAKRDVPGPLRTGASAWGVAAAACSLKQVQTCELHHLRAPDMELLSGTLHH